MNSNRCYNSNSIDISDRGESYPPPAGPCSLESAHLPSPQCLTCEVGEAVFRAAYGDKGGMFMCLHSWSYDLGEGKGTFKTDAPRWAEDQGVLEPVFEKREKLKRMPK